MTDGGSFYDRVVGNSTEEKKSPFNRTAPRSPFAAQEQKTTAQAAPASATPAPASKSPFTAPRKSPFAAKPAENTSNAVAESKPVETTGSDATEAVAPKRSFSVLGISIETPISTEAKAAPAPVEVPEVAEPVVVEPVAASVAEPVVKAQIPQAEAPQEDTPRRSFKKKEVNTMNVPESSMLNVDATPTVAAQAFLRAQEENHEKPSIATAPVPPVIEKKVDNSFNPFKPLKKPIESEKPVEEVKPQTPPKTAEEYFLPMKQKKAEPINPFKPNAKAPVKRAASASINRVEAEKAEAEALAMEEALKESERMSIYKALGTTEEVHTTFKVTDYKDPEEVVPFAPFKNKNTEE